MEGLSASFRVLKDETLSIHHPAMKPYHQGLSAPFRVPKGGTPSIHEAISSFIKCRKVYLPRVGHIPTLASLSEAPKVSVNHGECCLT